MFNIERGTLHRLIRLERFSAINLGTHLIRIKRSEPEGDLLTRKVARKEQAHTQTLQSRTKNCYTVGEICKKYRINDSSVWSHVRKYSIPTRQTDNYVCIPKEEIDNLYRSDVL